MEELPAVGAQVEIYGCQATVRFVGTTSFATGRWIGLELSRAVGKNDGSVQGQRYFECSPNHGVFVRASQLKDLAKAPPPTPPPMTQSSTTTANASASNKATAAQETDRRSTLAAGTTLNRPPPQMIPVKELEEVKLKLKILENKRAEDRDRLKDYEKLKTELEHLQLTKSQLSTKLEECQKEMGELKRTAKQSQSVQDLSEAKFQELNDQLELLALDKEMAEERADTLQLEVDELKQRVEEVTLSLEVYQQDREENTRMGGEGGDGNTSVEYVQLEKQNERLKEALIKLRDVTTAQEAELQKKLKAAERELLTLTPFKELYEQTNGRMKEYEEIIEALKEQLDDANSNNEMIERLSERNLKLSETVEELKVTVQDLEADKELNEELEENHLATEKELLREIDDKDALIRHQSSLIESVQDKLYDAENTIVQFRHLTSTLQSDLNALQRKYEVSEDENKELSSQSQLMLNLNLQLQSTASKATEKAIELELKKLTALQSADHLEIITPYLPQEFQENDNYGICFWLLMKRLSFKCQIILQFLDSVNNISGAKSVNSLKQRLYLTSALSLLLSGFIESASVESFLQLKEILPSFQLHEQRLDDVLKKLKGESIDSDSLFGILQSAVSQLEKFADSVKVNVKAVKLSILDFIQSFSFSCECLLSNDDNPEISSIAESLKTALTKCLKSIQSLSGEECISVKLFEELRETVGRQLEMSTVSIEKLRHTNNNMTELPVIVDRLKEQLEWLEALPDRLIEDSQLIDKISLIKQQHPWTARAEQLKKEYLANRQLEQENKMINEQLSNMSKDLKHKTENLYQNSIKIDLLETRMRNLSQQSEVVDSYEKELETLRNKEKSFMDTIELLQQEIEEMEKRIKTSQINTQQSVSAIPQSSQVLFSSQPLIDRLQLENRRLCSRDMKRKYALLLSDPLQKWSTTSNHSNNKHQNRINQELNGLLKDIYSASADCRVVSINTNDNNKKKWKSQKLLPEYQVYRQQSIMNTLKHRSRELERKYVCDVNKSVTGASEYPASVRFGSLVLPSNSNFEQKTVFMDIRQLSRLHSALVPVV